MTDSLFARMQAAEPRRGLYLYEDFADPPVFLSYEALRARILAGVEHFREQGLKPGDRIFLPFETSEAVIVSFFALLELGALPFSVKPYILSTPRQAYRDFLGRIAGRHRVSLILDVPSLKGLELPLRGVPLPSAKAPVEPRPLREPPPEALAFVQFSSGSTSFPKGIPVTWGNLTSNLRMFTREEHFTPEDRICSWLPLYHDMGLIGGLLCGIYGGCDVHQAQPTSFLMNAMGWLERMSEVRATRTVVPNFAIDYLLKSLGSADAEELSRVELSALHCLYLSSEPINIPNLERFATLMAPRGLARQAIKPGYGMAEVVLAVTCVGDKGWWVTTGPNGQQAISVGPPMGRFQLRLRAEDGRPCGERELGEIELKGESLADSYFEDERPLRGADGYFATGDLGFLQDGELFITGRLNDRIKINGQSYFSSDFEQAIERLPFIRAGRTVVIQAQGRIVVLAEISHPSVLAERAPHQRKVGEAILESVGVTVPPENVLFIRYGQIEKTSSGKLRRRAMTEAYEQGRIRIATPMTLRADLVRLQAQRLFYGSVLAARRHGSRGLQSGRAALGMALQAGLRRLRLGSRT